jgi:hypothetical protein
LKRVLAGLILSQEEFKTKWEGICETLTEDNFTMAFKRWLERCKKLFALAMDILTKVRKHIF